MKILTGLITGVLFAGSGFNIVKLTPEESKTIYELHVKRDLLTKELADADAKIEAFENRKNPKPNENCGYSGADYDKDYTVMVFDKPGNCIRSNWYSGPTSTPAPNLPNAGYWEKP